MISRRSFLSGVLSWPVAWPVIAGGVLVHADQANDTQREDTLTKRRPSTVDRIADAIVIKNENVYFVAQPDGNVPLTNNHGMGLYYHDCRYLNGYELALDQQHASHLSASSAKGAIGTFTLTNPRLDLPDGSVLDKEELGITWRRLLDNKTPALRDQLHFQNFTFRPVAIRLALTIQSEFEDVFAVRGLLPKRFGTLHPPAWEHDVLRLSYDGKDGIARTLTVHFDPPPDRHRGSTAEFDVRIGPRGMSRIDLNLVITESKDRPGPLKKPAPLEFGPLEAAHERETRLWMEQMTRVSSHGSSLDQLMARSFRALRVLRTHLDQETYFAAGVPWFTTLFGRDSLITAWEMLAYHMDSAEQTLRLLARYQGTRIDDWRDEQPGKIMHELRVGEMAHLDVIPHTPFYGTVDATPLFLMLLAEHARWTGSLRLFDELRPAAEAALGWMDRYGDKHGEEYLAYESHAKEGIINKGWKDSGDAIVNADGSHARPPIALVEVQGYGYAAKLGMAMLFDRAGEGNRAERLRREAQRLRERFNRDFWMEDHGCYALALQANGRQAAVVSSNPGQALWTGIADHDKAERTIRRLMEVDMFNGWGVRTLSSKARAYNPIGYHLGTVWPHDNSILAAGFRRYGHDREALDICQGLVDAAFHFRLHQLPELFCGYSRTNYEVPINYPVACHPQAWAAGALPFILTTLLGLSPDAFNRRLRIVRPLLPDFLDHLKLQQLRVGEATVDLSFQRGTQGIHVDVEHLEGDLEVQVDKGQGEAG